ncbi:hypothetical protein GCM10025872_30640 [Barrientosiimonas endolithica]|uniref:Uncharacterized protein n=1 Tax=Barrientosiimonas endolithica TaxID=1535208 RepID=A0ABM8HEI0_9MICO|nr:hypothetical protein GCM10025872_30640 [Barrientosiimonas endolithica]
MVEDLRLGQHAPGVEHEVAQQLELGRRDVDDLAAAAHLVGVLVELEVGDDQGRAHLVLQRLGAAQHRADAGDDLLEAERLRDVVVAADRQPLDLVVDRVARGEEDDGHVVAVAAQPPGHGEAVHVGEHHVHDREVEGVLLGEAERLLPVGRRVHLEPGELQARGQQLADVGLVLDDEQASLGTGGGHGTTVRRIAGRFLGTG